MISHDLSSLLLTSFWDVVFGICLLFTPYYVGILKSIVAYWAGLSAESFCECSGLWTRAQVLKPSIPRTCPCPPANPWWGLCSVPQEWAVSCSVLVPGCASSDLCIWCRKGSASAGTGLAWIQGTQSSSQCLAFLGFIYKFINSNCLEFSEIIHVKSWNDVQVPDMGSWALSLCSGWLGNEKDRKQNYVCCNPIFLDFVRAYGYGDGKRCDLCGLITLFWILRTRSYAFQIVQDWTYLHSRNELYWGWDLSVNTESISTSHISHTQSLKVTLDSS